MQAAVKFIHFINIYVFSYLLMSSLFYYPFKDYNGIIIYITSPVMEEVEGGKGKVVELFCFSKKRKKYYFTSTLILMTMPNVTQWN